ncbi:MAG: hypothetical protein V1743_05990 [Nanoarchaeota archaeon]
MVRNHLKRLNAPASWDIPRKKTVFVTRPAPGPHQREFSIPLSNLLKENLKLFPTLKLLKHAINNKQVLIDKKTAHNQKAAPGLMDTLSFPSIHKHYRMTVSRKGKLGLIEIPEKESALKIVKIINKHVLGKNKLQLNLSDGRNILTGEKGHATGDSLLLELPGQKIIEHFPLAVGSQIFVFKGKHTGLDGTIKEIRQDTVIFTHNREEDETKKEFIFVTGKTGHAVTLMNKASISKEPLSKEPFPPHDIPKQEKEKTPEEKPREKENKDKEEQPRKSRKNPQP